MYGIVSFIWLIFMVNVGTYTIHGPMDGRGSKISTMVVIMVAAIVLKTDKKRITIAIIIAIIQAMILRMVKTII